MSNPNECALDRHFAAQLRNLRTYSKEHPVSEEDFAISQLWMNHFQEAKGSDKFARNCMMMLMYGQLQEIGHLSKPFTEMENMNRSMDDLLNEYNGTTVEEQSPVVEDVQETETNASSYGGGSSRCSLAIQPLPTPEFEGIKQANRDLIKEIDSLHIRTVESERLYRSRNQMLEEKVADKYMGGKPELGQESVYLACRTAIELLKNWPGDTVRLNFLATCLEPFLRTELITSIQIAELDLSLEDILNNMVIQACSRMDDNVRMLYDHILRHDKDGLKEKEGKLRRLHESLRQERQRLRVLSEDLKQREDFIWRHQAIATLAVTGLPPEELVSPSISKCQLCHTGNSFRTGPIDQTYRIGKLEKPQSAEDLQKLSDALSDLSVDKW
ncbi:uncharacterized protein LOC119553829 [Drosophila subpulchrella]|uniref:uncharacterized protein LOC119553829 n=1 Tax=Drosophila subpulchrella TaxID=1486046 RepID=UPI0018A17CB4|nr:uncharacterized protein LOC119553829 [Drosophila subpulchrella]